MTLRLPGDGGEIAPFRFLSIVFLPGMALTGGSPLPLLNQGAETSLTRKKLIAECIGVSTGKRLRQVRQALRTLTDAKRIYWADPGIDGSNCMVVHNSVFRAWSGNLREGWFENLPKSAGVSI